jgi:hypothetical protein
MAACMALGGSCRTAFTWSFTNFDVYNFLNELKPLSRNIKIMVRVLNDQNTVFLMAMSRVCLCMCLQMFR